jgi:hypothetical protein
VLLGANEGQAGLAGTDPPGLLPCQTAASLPTVTTPRSSRHAISADLRAAGVRRRVLALRPAGRLPEAERRALVVGALGEQPVRLALGLVRVAAGRPDPLDRGGDVVDAVGQLHLGLRALRLDETEAIADATGTAPLAFGRLLLAGFRGDDAQASVLIEASKPTAIARGEGVVLTVGEHARAVLHNGLGHYQAALDPAQSASAQDELMFSVWSLPELVEAAARCAKTELAADALKQLCERTQAAGTELALGIEARSRALLSDGEPAERYYREAIQRLGTTRMRPALARTHLLYGEWLRREKRRGDAREHLRTAYEGLTAMGMEAFAARARGELVATGETVHKRTVQTRYQLTAQEVQIAPARW